MRLLILGVAACVAMGAQGQGTVIYDQQSSTDGVYLEGSNGDVRALTMGQSFTPTLSTVGFVRLFINNPNPSDTMNGVFYVTLRSGSISGAILGTSSLLTISPSASAPSNFIFSDAIPVNPGTMYYFNLVIQGGNRWATPWDRYNYASGVGYGNGVANANFDMWFREGIIVPEPGVMVLLGLGLLGYVVRRTKR